MKKTSFFRKYTRKESRFVSVSHFRYLHYYRVNISTAILHKSSLSLSFCNIYRVLQQKRDWKSYIISSRNLFKTPCSTTTNYPRQKATKLQKLEKRTTEEGKLLLACLASILNVFFVRLQNASFFQAVQRVKEIEFSALTFFSLLASFSSSLRGEIGRGQFQKATYFNCKELTTH